mgnify:CR=1 FL=1
MKDLILAIDCGTQSLRALLFDTNGSLINKSQLSLDYEAPQPGWGEQDPELFWQTLAQACQDLFAKQPDAKERLAGFTLTTQRGSVVNLDDNGKPLRPAIFWFDKRRCFTFKPVQGFWALAFRLIGMTDAIRYFQSMAEATWIEQNQPDIWNRTSKYLLLSGYLTYRLTGEYRDSVAAQVGYIPFDYKNHTWAAPSDWKWQVMRLRLDQLPELVEPGKLLGHISAQAAATTGIPEGLPMIASGADKACEILGSGVSDSQTAHLSFGTTATVNVLSNTYKEAVRFIPPYPAALPKQYSLEIQIFRGFWMVSWFKKQFGFEDEAEAKKSGRSAEELLEDRIREIPAGSEGLVLQPFWSPGLKVPGPEARGAVIGFSDWHNRYHIYRAILEGLLFSLREGKERIEKAGMRGIRRIVAAGGGSQSDVVMQMTADIFGMPVERPAIYEASGLGAAMIAAVGLNLKPDMATAVKEMSGLPTRFEPNKAVHKVYDRIYKNVYLKLYDRLKDLYKELA